MKAVNNAISQQCLRPDNNQLDTLFPGYCDQSFYVTRAYIQVMGNLSRAGITWSGINLLNFRAPG